MSWQTGIGKRKTCFVENRLRLHRQQAEELIELAEWKNLTIMVDHTFIYTGAVRATKNIFRMVYWENLLL